MITKHTNSTIDNAHGGPAVSTHQFIRFSKDGRILA